MARHLGFTCLFVATLSLTPTSASAQDVPLSGLLVNLIQSEVRLAPPPAGFVSHEAHFVPGVDQALAPYLFNQQLVSQLATYPTGSSSGGFSFAFDTDTGTFTRSTSSFGPSFAERALTNGRNRLSIGANFQYSKYNNFESRKLDSGDVKFYLTHQDVAGNNFFEGDLIEAALRLDVSSATTTFFANYGLTDTLDIAVAVPFVRVKMDATVDAEVLRIATGPGTTIHAFPGGSTTASFSDSGSATGIGDVLLRAKYRFVSTRGGGLAAGLDLRLPSGDSDDLLGTGAAAATLTLIGSSSHGRIAPHFNVSFFGSGDGDVVQVSNELGYKFGVEYAAAPTTTLTADFIGRRLINSGRLALANTTRTFQSDAGVPGSISLQEYQLTDGSLNLLGLALGGKFNVAGNLLINANVLLSLNDAGVTAKVTPVIGFDYSF